MNVVSRNLRNGWTVDCVAQKNHSDAGNPGNGTDYFFFKKIIEGVEYTLCVNSFNNTLTTSSVFNKNNNKPLDKDAFEMVIEDFVNNNLLSLIQVSWVKKEYV